MLWRFIEGTPQTISVMTSDCFIESTFCNQSKNCLGSREVWFVFELVVVGWVKNGEEKIGVKVKPQISRAHYIICKLKNNQIIHKVPL